MKLTKAYLGSTEITKAYLKEEVVISSETLGPELLDYSLLTSSSASFSQDGNNKWVYNDSSNGFLTMPNIAIVVGEQYRIVANITIASGNANFRIVSGNGAARMTEYTDYDDGINTITSTVTGVNGFAQRLFVPASLTDFPFTINSISIKKVL